MDAAADDGMQLWTALKREIDITPPSARSHAEDQLKTKTKQKHDETVAEFGLRFRDHDDDNAIIIPDIIRRTNERASLHDRIIRANPENRRRRLALPVQGRGGGRNGGRMGGRGGRNTERFDPQRHQRRCQNANCPAPHTHDTPMCYAPGGARHDPARWRGNTDAGRGGRGLAHGTTLTRADEEDAEARHLAQQFVGAILYAAVISRPDLSSTVRVMSHVMSKPPSNFEACKKHVLRSSDRDARGDNHENRRSTSGYIFFLNGGPISWASYLQTTVALSTVESEVMALTEAIKEAIYIRRLLESLGAAQEGPTIIYTDSTGAEALVDHPTSHRRTKHIEIRREFIKFHIGHETVKIERVSTKDQLVDIDEASRQDIHNYLVQMILHG
ncbi:hypothetical protein RI054_14g67910 [Pseudoscourfieldia marina]